MSDATCLLALPEFEVTDVWEFVDEAIVSIVMPRCEVACTRCGVLALHRVHDRVLHRARDPPATMPSGYWTTTTGSGWSRSGWTRP